METRIRWWQRALDCEFRHEGTGASLYVYSGGAVIHKEPASSILDAYARACQLSDKLSFLEAKRA
jgi:hypothetical protein